MRPGIPDYYFDDIYQITPDFFRKIGVSAVICDIDNTLVTYDDPEPTPPVCAWLESMKKAGIRFVFLSNNHPPRVERFAKSLSLPFYAEAKKPGTKVLLRALADLGVRPDRAASLGDQIFTDVLTGQRAGLKTVLVPPIRDRTDLFHRIKRLGERPFVAAYFRAHPGREVQHQKWKALTGQNRGAAAGSVRPRKESESERK